MLRNVSIGIRIVGIIAVLVLAIAGLVATIVFTAQGVKNDGIVDAQAVMLEGEKAKIKLGVQTIAHSLSKALQGVTDPARQAQIIADHINGIRFEADKSGYYFVYRGTVVCVHPVQPKLVGQDLKATPDVNGVLYVSELNKAAHKGGDFVSFVFGKPRADGSVANAPKLAYAEMIPGTDLWISTGIYIDNIDVYKADMTKRMSDKLFNQMLVVIGCVGVLLLCILLPLCLLTVRSIVLPLKETKQAAERIAGGNLDVHLSAEGRDEVTALQIALQRMAANLKDSLEDSHEQSCQAVFQASEAQNAARLAEECTRKITETNTGMLEAAARLEDAVNEMQRTASNISHDTAGVKDGTNIQDERVRDIRSAMEQLGASIGEVARNASTAAQKADESRNKVEKGRALARESGDAMRDLRESSDELTGNIHKLGAQSENIGKIINVINDIADQTNLLALNAAIEAARAGDAGRGFAVVADEVRKLAEKTMQATHEVQTSIVAIQDLAKMNISGMDDATQAMGRVNSLSEETEASLTEVSASVLEAASQVSAIAAAVDQQSTSSGEVTKLVDAVSTIASTNSTLVAQADEELRALAAKAGGLQRLVADLRRRGNTAL